MTTTVIQDHINKLISIEIDAEQSDRLMSLCDSMLKYKMNKMDVQAFNTIMLRTIRSNQLEYGKERSTVNNWFRDLSSLLKGNTINGKAQPVFQQGQWSAVDPTSSSIMNSSVGNVDGCDGCDQTTEAATQQAALANKTIESSMDLLDRAIDAQYINENSKTVEQDKIAATNLATAVKTMGTEQLPDPAFIVDAGDEEDDEPHPLNIASTIDPHYRPGIPVPAAPAKSAADPSKPHNSVNIIYKEAPEKEEVDLTDALMNATNHLEVLNMLDSKVKMHEHARGIGLEFTDDVHQMVLAQQIWDYWELRRLEENE